MKKRKRRALPLGFILGTVALVLGLQNFAFAGSGTITPDHVTTNGQRVHITWSGMTANISIWMQVCNGDTGPAYNPLADCSLVTAQERNGPAYNATGSGQTGTTGTDTGQNPDYPVLVGADDDLGWGCRSDGTPSGTLVGATKYYNPCRVKISEGSYTSTTNEFFLTYTVDRIQCDDQADNDSDQAVDLFDRDCGGPNDNTESGSFEPQCSNGVDDDGDGKKDFGTTGDPDCSSDDDTLERATQCSDGADNDGDGAIDSNDADCSGPDDDSEGGTAEPQCSDGTDNDGDGKIDFGSEGDPDCSSDNDNNEATPQCNDGLDNDNDGATDSFDRDCGSAQDETESGSREPQCSDGKDNDGDGKVDGGDADCSNADDNKEATAPSCNDADGDGTNHSALNPGGDETGPVSGAVHGLDQSLPAPVGGDQGVLAEVNCGVVVRVGL